LEKRKRGGGKRLQPDVTSRGTVRPWVPYSEAIFSCHTNSVEKHKESRDEKLKKESDYREKKRPIINRALQKGREDGLQPIYGDETAFLNRTTRR